MVRLPTIAPFLPEANTPLAETGPNTSCLFEAGAFIAARAKAILAFVGLLGSIASRVVPQPQGHVASTFATYVAPTPGVDASSLRSTVSPRKTPSGPKRRS